MKYYNPDNLKRDEIIEFKISKRDSGKCYALKQKIEKEFCKTLGIDYKDFHKHDRLLLDEETARTLLAFEIIKQCFTLNGFDELIPNEKWWDNESKQDFIRGMLK